MYKTKKSLAIIYAALVLLLCPAISAKTFLFDSQAKSLFEIIALNEAPVVEINFPSIDMNQYAREIINSKAEAKGIYKEIVYMEVVRNDFYKCAFIRELQASDFVGKLGDHYVFGDSDKREGIEHLFVGSSIISDAAILIDSHVCSEI